MLQAEVNQIFCVCGWERDVGVRRPEFLKKWTVEVWLMKSQRGIRLSQECLSIFWGHKWCWTQERWTNSFCGKNYKAARWLISIPWHVYFSSLLYRSIVREQKGKKYKEESCMRKFNMADKGNMNDMVSLTVEEKPHCRHQGSRRGSLKTKPHINLWKGKRLWKKKVWTEYLAEGDPWSKTTPA